MKKLMITKEMIYIKNMETELYQTYHEDETIGAVSKLKINHPEIDYLIDLGIDSSIIFEQGTIKKRLMSLGNLKDKMFNTILNNNKYKNTGNLFEIEYIDNIDFKLNEEALNYLKELQKETDVILTEAIEEQVKNWIEVNC